MSRKDTENIEEKNALRISNPCVAQMKRLFTLPEAAYYLGRTVPAVRALIYRGELGRGVQDGPRAKIWLPKEDLDAWIDKSIRPLAFDKPARSRDGRGRFAGGNGVNDEG